MSASQSGGPATSAWPIWQEFNRCAPPAAQTAGGLVARIADASARHSGLPAVRAPDGELTYRELQNRSDAVARFLRQSGIPAGSTVAVTASRSVHPYVAILGILKAGCAYVPVNPADPADRLRYIIADSGAVATLAVCAEVAGLDWLAGLDHIRAVIDDGETADGRWARLAGAAGEPSAQRTLPGPPEGEPARLCYIIYTSGTTGRPKGVRISEASVVNFLDWFISTHPVLPADRLCQTAPLTFDPSVQQIMPAWVTGACLLPVPDSALHDPSAFLRWLRQQRITHLDVVTSHWHHLRHAAEHDEKLRILPDLRWIVIGGETLYYRESHRWHQIVASPALLDNIYGPTEATINASFVVVDPAISAGKVPIGVPLPGYRLYVVDPAGRLCDPGETGELLIAGRGVALGYQSAEATLRAFGHLDLPDGSSERVYRTGDLARLIGTGSGRLMLEFCGRADSQVKIRGYRIELAEIEAVVTAHPCVQAAAIDIRSPDANQMICAYAAGADLPPELLRAYLVRQLASYQVPDLYLRLDRLPVTANGKLDRPAIKNQLEERLASRQPIGPEPKPGTERDIADAFAAILGLGMVASDENFFSLGGTSLLAASLAVTLRSAGLRALPGDIISAPTPAALAARLTGG